MSDVKFSQYERATLEAWRSKRLGFESDTRLIEYDWSDGSTSGILSMNSVSAVVNTVSSVKVTDGGYIGGGASLARFVFGTEVISLTAGSLNVAQTVSATEVWVGGSRKDANWDTAYTNRITLANAPLTISGNSITLRIDSSLTISGGGVLGVASVAVGTHNSLSGLQGGSVSGSQFYHMDVATYNTVTANTVNWTAAYDHIAATGASHSYINQAVTIGASPQFAGLSSTDNIVINDVTKFLRIGGATDNGAFRIELDAANYAALFKIRNSGGTWVTCMTVSIA